MTDGLTGEILRNARKARFHTPSHAKKLDKKFALCDVTELPYSDNLLSPETVIKKLEQTAASAYGAEACFISTQGATHSVFQAVFSAGGNGGAFLIVGKTHVSFYNAMRVFGYKAYHTDKFDGNTPVPGDVGCAVFTSPDYEGNCLDLACLCGVMHRKNIAVIVDSAHGSHFAFSSKLPPSAALYADLTVCSLHKTMPVITGGSILLAKKKYADRCSLCRKMLHTTSPSYPVMCSIESAIEDFSANGEKYYDKCLSAVGKFVGKLPKPFFVIKNDDPTRLVVRSPYDGKALYGELLKRGVAAEAAVSDGVIFIVNPYNVSELKKVLRVLKEIGSLPCAKKNLPPFTEHNFPVLLEFGGNCEEVPLRDAEGRRGFLEIGFYPPGVPLLYSHDTITKEIIGIIEREKADCGVFGLDNGMVFVLK